MRKKSYINNAIVWLFIFAMFTGCQTNPQKAPVSEQSQKTFIDYYQAGLLAYQQWDTDEEQVHFLQQANQLQAQAYAMNPWDLNVQVEYYRTQYMLLALANQPNSTAQLQDYYASMHPLAQESFSPPAILEYQIKKQNQLPKEDLFTELMQALQQSPLNSQTWSNIHDYYYDQQQYNLSIAAASVALKYSPDNAYFNHEMGIALSAKAENSDCLYEEKDLLKRSVHYINQAHAKDNSNWHYVSNASFQYMNLGLTPLAWNQAQKAVDLEVNIITTTRYMELAILLKKYDDAFAMFEKFAEVYGKDVTDIEYERIFTLLAILAYSEHQSDTAKRFVYRANTFTATHFYQIHARWLYKSSQESFDSSLSKINSLLPYEQTLVDYLVTPQAPKIEDFIAQAKNACQRSDFYFTAADRAYAEGKRYLAEHYLEKVLEQKATRQLSHLWAKFLIDMNLEI